MCDHPQHHIGQTAPIILAAFIATASLLGASASWLLYTLIYFLVTRNFPAVTTYTSIVTGLVSLIVLTRMTMSAESDDYP